MQFCANYAVKGDNFPLWGLELIVNTNLLSQETQEFLHREQHGKSPRLDELQCKHNLTMTKNQLKSKNLYLWIFFYVILAIFKLVKYYYYLASETIQLIMYIICVAFNLRVSRSDSFMEDMGPKESVCVFLHNTFEKMSKESHCTFIILHSKRHKAQCAKYTVKITTVFT